MHTCTFPNGHGVSVSELINNEAVKLRFKTVAGAVAVNTEFFVSEQAARELGRLLVKLHDPEAAADQKKQSELHTRQRVELGERNAFLLRQVADLQKEILQLRSKAPRLRTKKK